MRYIIRLCRLSLYEGVCIVNYLLMLSFFIGTFYSFFALSDIPVKVDMGDVRYSLFWAIIPIIILIIFNLLRSTKKNNYFTSMLISVLFLAFWIIMIINSCAIINFKIPAIKVLSVYLFNTISPIICLLYSFIKIKKIYPE